MKMALVLAALLFGATTAAGQRPAPPPAPAAPGAGEEDPLTRLVKQISEDLAAVDKALQQATDADSAKTPLDQARASHLQAIRDIEELVKQVKYRKGKSGSSSGQSSQSKPGDSNGVKGKPQPRENDASSAPTPKPGGKDPKSEQQQAEQQAKDAAEKNQPKGGAKDKGRPEQGNADQPPPQDPLGRFQRTDTDARWGLLPPKMQERLMNLHVDDVPERYRAWLESYIHALNRLEEQGGGAAR